ncbi:hypothetical protein B0H16DRAFT_1449809 [Mycena metata]|uniref:Uncharacterized protein n=1 Tax=Mycena metata TaxID=1033252 RepID=A0AAD7K1H5_9AGAR|nr:hypothetical protein B0H16DRAFT_1449809 [Mycena metata]
MAGHNSRSASYGSPNHLQATPTHLEGLLGLKKPKHRKKRPPSTLAVETPVGSHAPNAASSMNEEELKEKARERMSRLRSKAFDDPEFGKTQAAMRRAHDATYREKHRKSIQFKATLRLFDAQWKKHAGPPPRPRDKRDFTQEFEWFQEDRKGAMAAHSGTGR